MAMQDVINDCREILNSGGFETDIKIKPSSSGTEKTIKGLGIKHHIGRDSDGNMINAKNANVTLHEDDLKAASYTVRNTKGEVAMRNHIVTFADSTGTNESYVITDTYPDETTGIIVCILGEYNGS